MSSLDFQDRPNSAIYLGSPFTAAQDAVLFDNDAGSAPTTPLTDAAHRLGTSGPSQLPSPPHTISTSGSTGDKDSANAGSIRRKAGVPLLSVVHDEDDGTRSPKMQNGHEMQYEDDDDDLTRRLTPAEKAAQANRITPKIERARKLTEKNTELLDKLSRISNLGSGLPSGINMSPTPRTASLGRTASATNATSSMRHASLVLPRTRDVFDQDAEPDRLMNRSVSGSVSEDDRAKTPPAKTPDKRFLEISPRQRLVSEPTTPNRLNLLRNTMNAATSLRRGTGLRSEYIPEDDDKKGPVNGSAKKSRTPIPLEFMDNARTATPSQVEDTDGTLLTIARPTSSRQPSPGLYTSEGSPSMGSLSATLGESATVSRRPRPAGLRNSYDRWGEPYENWEKAQMESQNQGEISPGTETDVSQQRRPGVRSVVNEGLKAAGLTRASTAVSSMRRAREETVTRSRTSSSLAIRNESLVTSPTSLDPSSALSRLSSERERSRSRIDERATTDIDSLRERSSSARHTFFSPNVRATRTIHNVLSNKPPESPNQSPDQLTPMDGRETPANLRLFKSNYSSTPMGKAYTSPSGTQRHLPARSVASNVGLDSPRQAGTGLNANNMSSNSLNPDGGPVQLLNDALYMFESHVQRLPQSSSTPDTYGEVLRDAKGIASAAAALNVALRSAAGVCVDEQIEAEVQAQSESNTESHLSRAEVWKKVAAEFREDVRVSDELVRALTSFMIGTGRMLRSANTTNHSRMQSTGDASSAVGSVSRASGTALIRGGSVRGAGSSDGRRSVEGWTRGIGMAGGDRRSVDGRPSHDGRRSVDPAPYSARRSAEEHREDTMRRLNARQAALDQLEGGSTGSGGGSSGPRFGSHRVSYNDSRSQTSLSMIRDVPRLSQDESLSSPGPRTFTSLSSRRSTGAPTPAMSQKALPKLPLPPAGGELSFPQTEDGGDRTPIELPRPHNRHSTMPALAVPPPLPTLPSERIIQQSKTPSKHGASNSVTSASTTSTTRPKTLTRNTMILSSPSTDLSTPTLSSTGERSRRPSASSVTSPFSMGRTRGSAILNGMNQSTVNAQSRKRTISITDDDGFPAPKENQPTLTSSADVLGSHSRAAGGWSSANASPTIGARGASGRPLLNRRTSSTLSGAPPVTSPGLSTAPSAAKPRVVSRMSSTGNLENTQRETSPRHNLVSAEATQGTDSGQDDERRLRRSRVRLSSNVGSDKRSIVSDLLAARRAGTTRPRGGTGDYRDDPNGSPSLGARDRRERRQAEAL